MKTKRILSFIIAVVLCLSSLVVYAESEEVVIAPEEVVEEIIVPTEQVTDDPTEEIVAMPEGDDDGNIDYSDMSNWAYWNEGENTYADLFFICPTVDMGKAGNLIADINNEKYRNSFVGATNMELGIYSDVATVYAPYYRQATFPVYNLAEEEREVYLDFAYQDIKDAFIHYVKNTDSRRPLILAGFSQGADLAIRLMKDMFDEPKYQRRLVAAYCIGWKLTESEIAEYPHLKPAQGETDTGVIVAFNSEAEDVTSSLILGENEKTYAINPLNWKTNSDVADKSLNAGACFTDYSGDIKEETPAFTGAYIDEKRGALKVTDVSKEEYSSSLFDEGVYHLYDYQFFFRNLQKNVNARLSAYNEKYADRIHVFYNDELIIFDVEPVIENGRTLVPFRAIFEAMGCAVSYAEENGTQIVSARRTSDNLFITIGENKMLFNGKEIALDVPAKIKDGRTLVPIRAISEAFECEVFWYGDSRTIYIDSPAQCYLVFPAKLSETVTDDNGNVLVEAVAYYPVIVNPIEIPYIDEINSEYKAEAENFIEEAKAKKEDAELLRSGMGEDFRPFAFELTFEQTHNALGEISFTNYKYINVGGMHPTTILESRNFCIGLEEERSLSKVIDQAALEVSLTDYVVNLFVEKLGEIDPELKDVYTYEYILEYIGYLQFYITNNSVVLYFNQGEITPYALGIIKVEIPYDPELFYLDMSYSNLDEFVYELEYDSGYEWQVAVYPEENLLISEESKEYDPESRHSESYPAGVQNFTLKGTKKGNVLVIFAHAKSGEDVESATHILLVTLYVDENNKITCISEEDGMYLLN